MSILYISELRSDASKILESRRNQRILVKFGAKSLGTINLVDAILNDLISKAVVSVEASREPQEEAEDGSKSRSESPADNTVSPIDDSAFLDPVDAAVRQVNKQCLLITICFERLTLVY